MAKSFYSSTTKPGAAKPKKKIFDIPGPKKAAIILVALGSEA